MTTGGISYSFEADVEMLELWNNLPRFNALIQLPPGFVKQQAWDSIEAFIHQQQINMKQNTILNDIDRSTKEGQLLFAAIIELTTRLHTNKTPDEVIEMLWGIHNNTMKANQEKRDPALKSCSAGAMVEFTSPFSDALKAFEKQSGFDRARKLDTFKTAGDVVLHHADSALMKNDKDVLTKMLIDIYKEVEKD